MNVSWAELRASSFLARAESIFSNEDNSTSELSKAQVSSRLMEFGTIIGSCFVVLGLLAVCSLYKKTGVLSLGPLSWSGAAGWMWRGEPIFGKSGQQHKKLNQELEDLDEEEILQAQANRNAEYPCQHRLRGFVLFVLFCIYVGASLGIPYLKRGTVSCSNGFFWEDHMLFGAVVFATKIVELSIFAFDPTIFAGDQGLFEFFKLFLPSMLGFVDGYTDSTAITIAASCDTPFSQNLAISMLTTYCLGVILLQWIVIGGLALFDDSHICLMKLLHMDALAGCVNIPPDQEWKWRLINYARTFGEDIPQAIQQSLFMIYVKDNSFMLLSVAVSVGCSCKALRDALTRSRIVQGAFDLLAADVPDAPYSYGDAQERAYVPGGSATLIEE
mmetsp:Transcript_102142/g.181414  ORF Transcript_102142/g.181414 Transcript_102142/m.181414 type:complete len:387 (-) Transcript_102142:295-1455(-)